jgi:NRAMP (natural resistance-associated macrophage protein)-like metal ion transporter
MAHRWAVLDDAHVGDIRGALGTIRRDDVGPRHSWWARLLTLLAIMGPGLIVMVGDNDAGGVATYLQAGQNYGTSLLWVLLLLIPVLIVNQEMVVRLGLVTGVGHARLIFERFGKFWGAFSVGDLFVLNFLTIVTEFIGISLGMNYFGVSPMISVPLAAVALILFVVTGSFRYWERWMYLCVAVSLLTIPLAFAGHPAWGPIVRGLLVPGVQGGLSSTAMLLIISLVGTTVAPWQLFFQQSNVIDKRLTPRWMAYERLDLSIGAVLTIVGAAALMIVTAFAFHRTPVAGQFVDAGRVAQELRQYAGPIAGTLEAIVLINASIIGAAAVTLSTAYAFGDVFKVKHSLHRRIADAKGFYAMYGLTLVTAAVVVLTPGMPLGLLTEAVQALAGILLPSAIVFLLLLCNDKAVLGPWVNKPWLNMVASAIVGVLIMLSLILAVTTLFPDSDVRMLTVVLGVVLVAALLVVLALEVRRTDDHEKVDPVLAAEKATWRMPPLVELPKPEWSMARKVGMITLRGYLLLAVVMMVVKVVLLAITGHVH